MIFVTVGTQLPFERLVAAVDAWAGGRLPPPDVLAQVGAGRLDHRSLTCVRSLDGPAYTQAIANATLLIAHAGIGSVLSALDHGVPVIVMPRDPRRGDEHRDDHQVRSARQLETMGLVRVAWSETELPGLIEESLQPVAAARVVRRRSSELVDYLRSYLQDVLRR